MFRGVATVSLGDGQLRADFFASKAHHHRSRLTVPAKDLSPEATAVEPAKRHHLLVNRRSALATRWPGNIHGSHDFGRGGSLTGSAENPPSKPSLV